MWRKTFKRPNRPNYMFMPVEEDEKTEGHTESKSLKKNNVSKRKKENKGKLIFYGKNCLHGSEKEKKKLMLFKRYCEENGKWKRKNGKGKLIMKTKTRRKVKAKRKKTQCNK